jgi:hypothetical protein
VMAHLCNLDLRAGLSTVPVFTKQVHDLGHGSRDDRDWDRGWKRRSGSFGQRTERLITRRYSCTRRGPGDLG